MLGGEQEAPQDSGGVAGAPAAEPRPRPPLGAAVPRDALELGDEAGRRLVAAAHRAEVEAPGAARRAALGEEAAEVRAHRLRQQDRHARLRAGALDLRGEELRDVDRRRAAAAGASTASARRASGTGPAHGRGAYAAPAPRQPSVQKAASSRRSASRAARRRSTPPSAAQSAPARSSPRTASTSPSMRRISSAWGGWSPGASPRRSPSAARRALHQVGDVARARALEAGRKYHSPACGSGRAASGSNARGSGR